MKGAKTYIQVILPVRFRDTVTYSVPDELLPDLHIGSRVEVMLGYRKYKGFVEEITQTPKYDIRKIRDILSIDSEITAIPEDIRFWRTIADYYMCSSGEALKAATPFLMELLTKREKKSKAIESMPETAETDILGTETTVFVPEHHKNTTLGTKTAHFVPKFIRTPQDSAQKGELYLESITKLIQEGKSTLILTPDIAACRKMEKTLSPHFGDKIITYHSGQTTAKRREATKALLSPSPHIIIGLRSALFLPFRNLGLVIVDEEHSPLYKQSEPTPRYHGRDTALILAQLHNADIILGSPTPSFETLHNVMIGKYQELATPQEPAPIFSGHSGGSLQIVDFSKEFRTGSTKGPLTNIALAALRDSAEKGIRTAILRPKWAYPQEESEWRPELEEALSGIRTEIFTEIQQMESLKTKPTFMVVIHGESLLSPKNFRAEERALQHISKIVELVQSGKKGGRVILQTSLYRHNIFRYLCGKVPFETLLQERAELNLPPFSRVIQITMHCDSLEKMEVKGMASITKKQRIALELLTSGRGMTFKEIAEEVGVNPKTLWEWRNSPEYVMFQDELKRLNDIRWQAAEDAARESAIRLCKDGNQKMVEFVLKNAGYNPTQKVEADISTDIQINIEE
jgi:primosomal protein N'